MIYTLLFLALVYNYAIFSQTSPYFFVPGDAPRSKSARHEGVVKSTRLEERVEPKVSSASPGWWPFGRTPTPYAPDILSPYLSFFILSLSPFPSLHIPFYPRFVDKTSKRKRNRILSIFFLSPRCSRNFLSLLSNNISIWRLRILPCFQ